MQRREAGQLNQVVYRRRPHPDPRPAARQPRNRCRQLGLSTARHRPTRCVPTSGRRRLRRCGLRHRSVRARGRKNSGANHAPTLFAKRVPVAIAEPDSYPNAHAFTASLAWPKPDARDINDADADSAASAKSAAFTDANADPIADIDAGLPGARRRQPPRPRRQRRP